ncbi:uncharacterized protein si:ch211-170d8.2 [Betta splendens]|uniref:Uncharacterized protein si:ch211-170d8.2 n=1 Tax=Betta splendens TaxID=158456 RepID=A0A6P7NBG6_BETSP|nr:uncharacterized protein si:ch211-170d8.2 [Betta splendens]
MTSSCCIWIALFLCLTTTDTGAFARAVNSRPRASPSPKSADETPASTLRTDASRRQRCAELAAPWAENTQRAPEENATTLQVRLRPFSTRASRGLVFPGKLLFGLVRQVYHCCQERLTCRSVKGIPGRFRGDTDVEFLLTKEALSLSVTRVELHLQFTNPQHLDIRPVLPFMEKRNLPSRYSLWSRGGSAELRVDLLFLLQELQEAAGGVRRGPDLVNLRRLVFSSRGTPLGEQAAAFARQDTDGDSWGEGFDAWPSTDLGLVVGCSQAGSGVSCRTGGVHLSHIPFLALYYR